MKTYLIFKTDELINNLSLANIKYEINTCGSKLVVNKKYLTKRGRPFSVKLPKKIKITPEAIGLIVGEGYIGDRNFIFANSGGSSIIEVKEFLEQFKIPIKNYLEVSTKNKNKNFIKNSKEYWEKLLRIRVEKVRERKEFKSITNNGTLHLILNNKLIAKLLEQIIMLSKFKIEKDFNLSAGYLRGILAAEGNINVKSKTTNCLYMVRISASKIAEREHYKRCLEKVGIKIYCKDMPTISKIEGKKRGWKTDKGRAGAVLINRWDNFVKIINLDLLSLNKEKNKKFFKYFMNNKFTKQFLDFKCFINKEFTMKEAQQCFGFKGRRLNRVLTLLKKGYISREKINKRNFKYGLTDKYLELYYNLNSL